MIMVKWEEMEEKEDDGKMLWSCSCCGVRGGVGGYGILKEE